MRIYPNLYSQRDPIWSSQRLGTVDGVTIGEAGCYLTCFAMRAGYYGHTITPNALNDIFTQKGIYQNGDLLTDNALSRVFPDILFQQTYPYIGVAADLGKLQELSADDSLTIGLELDFDHDPSDGIQTHFVEVHSFDGKILMIYDPWYGTLDDFTLHYGTDPGITIQKFVVSKGSPVQSTVAVPSDVFPILVDKATKYDAFHAAGYVTISDVITKVGDSSDQNAKLTQEIADAKAQSSAAHDQMAKMAQEDSSAIETGLKAQGDLNSLKSLLNAHAGSVGCPTDNISPLDQLRCLTDTIASLRSQNTQVVASHQTLFDLFFDMGIYKKLKEQTPTIHKWFGWLTS